MRRTFYYSLLLLAVLLLPGMFAMAQLPVCIGGGTGYVYVHASGTGNIYNWDPTQPVSPTNPSLNTISTGTAGNGLSVGNNLNSPTGPSPTFYTIINNNFHYYNGTAWVNTGHSTGNTAAVNIGAGGNYIYNLVGGTGQVYKYDGTGNATLLMTVPGFNGGGPYDLVADCAGNFYILKCVAPAWLRKYDPMGTLLQEWSVTGSASTGAGGGFAIVDNVLYIHNGTLYAGPIGATSINVSVVPSAGFPSPGDFANCPIGGNYVSVVDTAYNCSSAGSEIVSTGNAPYTYDVISGSATVTGNGPTFHAVADVPSTVVVYGQSSSLCSVGGLSVDTYFVVPAPTITIAETDTLFGCGFYSDTLHMEMDNTQTWIPYNISWAPSSHISWGATTSSPVIHPDQNMYFTVTVKTPADRGNCTITDSVLVSVVDKSVMADFDFEIKYGCDADSVIFDNTSFQSDALKWDLDDGSPYYTASHLDHRYAQQGLYQVTLYASNDYCRDTAIKVIDTRHTVKADFNALDTVIACDGREIPFTNTSTATFSPFQSLWNFGDGNTTTAPSPRHTYANPGTYHVTLSVTDSIGCMDSLRKTVIIDTLPHLELLLDKHALCTGEPLGLVAKYTESGLTNVQWSFGDGSPATDTKRPQHTYENPGTYWISLLVEYRACSELSAIDSVVVYGFPKVNLGPDTTLCPGSMALTLQNLANGADGQQLSYLWNTGSKEPSIKVTEPGIYSLRVSNAHDCATEDVIEIQKDCYIDIPNTFTPNGDGVNDYFYPRQLLSKGVTAFEMKVYSRWGQLVFASNVLMGRGWDGRFNGVDQPEGTYIYVIDVVMKDGRQEQYKGNVTLLR